MTGEREQIAQLFIALGSEALTTAELARRTGQSEGGILALLLRGQAAGWAQTAVSWRLTEPTWAEGARVLLGPGPDPARVQP